MVGLHFAMLINWLAGNFQQSQGQHIEDTDEIAATMRRRYILSGSLLFISPEPKAQGELKVSYCDRSLSVVGPSSICLSSVNFFFKQHLLLNQLSKFHITSHECSP